MKKTIALISVILITLLFVGIILFMKYPNAKSKRTKDLIDRANEYGLDLSGQDFEMINYYYENAFTEFWYVYTVSFPTGSALSYDLNPETYRSGVTSETKVWLDSLVQSHGIKQLSPDPELRSKVIYNSQNDRLQLHIVYDSSLDLYHFIFVAE